MGGATWRWRVRVADQWLKRNGGGICSHEFLVREEISHVQFSDGSSIIGKSMFGHRKCSVEAEAGGREN